jgi:hypothetical protein
VAKFLHFFPRQTYAGDSSANPTTYYSDIYDVHDAESIYWEVRWFARSVNTVTGTFTLEHTDDISASAFSTYQGSITFSGAPGLVSGSSANIPRRYMRAKLDMTNGQYATVSFIGRAFC